MKKAIMLIFFALASHSVFAEGCIPSGDETAINAALDKPDAKAVLCPNAVFNLQHEVALSQQGQQIFTQGRPTDESRAILRVAGAQQSTAISSRKSGIFIGNIVIDGARTKLGRIDHGGALIEIGGEVKAPVVDHIRAYDPRGWSVLHVFEGGDHCEGARVVSNILGPAGTPDHAWADGISFACANGTIVGNTVIDASDGGIVIFGAPGTLVENNTVETKNNILLGGINLVDYTAFKGNYTNTIVRNNQIKASGGFIKVGIAIGPDVWGFGRGIKTTGGTVENNRLEGNNFGYGIAVAGATNVNVSGNTFSGTAKSSKGTQCDKNLNYRSTNYVRDPENSSGTFQTEFSPDKLRYLICVNPISSQ